MSTLEAVSKINPDTVDAIEEFLCGLDESRWVIFQEKAGDAFFLKGYFDDQPKTEQGQSEIESNFPDVDFTWEINVMEDVDWKENYKQYLKPWHCESLHWIPLWQKGTEENVNNGDAVVYIDAGMAFGTGTHETTQLCARRLVDFKNAHPEQFKNVRLIDAGCGSGILALSAKKLGIDNIMAFDHDPDAIRVATENAAINQVDSAINFQCGDIETRLHNEKADVILANILANILVENRKHLLDAINPKGSLVLSGILKEEVESVIDSFSNSAKELWGNFSCNSRTAGEWADVLLVRN